jgi:hypothetical protein
VVDIVPAIMLYVSKSSITWGIYNNHFALLILPNSEYSSLSKLQ